MEETETPANKVAKDVKSFFKKYSSNVSTNDVLGLMFKKQPSLRETLKLPPNSPPSTNSQIPNVPQHPIKLFLNSNGGGYTNLDIIQVHGYPLHIKGAFKWYRIDKKGMNNIPSLVNSCMYYPSWRDVSYRICCQWYPSIDGSGDGSADGSSVVDETADMHASSFAELLPISIHKSVLEGADNWIQGDLLQVEYVLCGGEKFGNLLSLEKIKVADGDDDEEEVKCREETILRISQKDSEVVKDLKLSSDISINVDGRAERCKDILFSNITGIEKPVLVKCMSHEQRECIDLALSKCLNTFKSEQVSDENELVVNRLNAISKLYQSVLVEFDRKDMELNKCKSSQAQEISGLAEERDALKSRAMKLSSRVQELEEKLGKSEVNDEGMYKNTIQRLSEEITSGQEGRIVLENRIAELKGEMEDLITRHQTERDENKILKLDLADLNDQIQSLIEIKNQVALDNQKYVGEIHQLKEEICRLTEKSEEQQKIYLLHQELTSKAKVLKTDRDRLRKELASAEENISIYALEMDKLKKKSVRLSKSLESSKEKNALLQSQLQSLTSQIENSTKESEQDKEESEDVSVSITEDKEVVSDEEKGTEPNSLTVLKAPQAAESEKENSLRKQVEQLLEANSSKQAEIDRLVSEKNGLSHQLKSIQKDISKLLKSTKNGKGILDQQSVGTERYQVLVSKVSDLEEDRNSIQKSLEMYKSAFEQQVALAAELSARSSLASFGENSILHSRVSQLLKLSNTLSESLGERDIQIQALKEICRVLQSQVSDLNSSNVL